MLADTLVILSLALSVIAACLFVYDAIWAQGARFQRDNEQSKMKSIEDLIESEKISINNLPAQYTDSEKYEMIQKFTAEWTPRLSQVKSSLDYWEKHPERVQQYALIGVGVIAIASILQGVAYFLEP